jgi:hypothetical protein
MTEYDSDLLREGILHFKAKEISLARRYFERALDSADDLQTQAEANYYLSLTTDDPRKKRQFLEETLAVDMGHAAARRELAILDGKLKPAEIINPDAFPAPVPGTQEVQADRFTCPKCGARMVYAPDGASLVCEHCNRQQSLGTAATGAGQDFFVAMANGTGFRKTISVKTFQCQGCGANFLLAPSELSGACAYCGSVHVIAIDRERELVEPDTIIPMAFGQKQAVLYMRSWLEQEHIQPLGLVTSPRGLYLPVWTFDLIGSIPWSGLVMRDKRTVPVSGDSPATFHDVGVPASPTLAGLLPGLLPGYDLSAASAYDPRFLAGWPAEVYATTMSDAALEARRICVEKVRSNIRFEHGNVIDLRCSPSAISITSYKLVLLPVWVADYSFEGSSRRAVINGQTGAAICLANRGDTPRYGLKDLLGDLLGT